MATYSQDSGALHLSIVRGDELGTVIDFTPTDLTGYTVASDIHSLVTGETVATATVSIVSATAGTVNLALSETETSALKVGTYGWRMYWDASGNVRRTALSGTLEVKSR
jgi:hypothetical protein